MRDLFTLQDDREGGSTETSNIFSQLSGDVNIEIHNDTHDKQESVGAKTEGTNSCTHETSSSKGKEKADRSDGEVDEETNVLKSLFDVHGIHVRFLFTFGLSQVIT